MTFRGLLTRNPGWKLVSVILAVLVWMMLDAGVQERLQPGARRVFSRVPVKVMTAAADPRAFLVEPESVEVTVRAERELVDRLQDADVEVYVDVSAIKEIDGLRRRVSVRLPGEVSLVQVKPSDVFVDLVNGEPAVTGAGLGQ